MIIARIAAAVCLAFLLVSTTFANGAPIRIQLSKIAGVVNYGTQAASGFAEITAVEGDVLIVTDGLPRLTNELYQAWLVNTRTGERASVGKFNVTADGTSRTQAIITLGNREFDLFVLTVEPEPDPAAAPDPRIVLAGYWPGREPGAALTAAAATARAGGTPQPTDTPAPSPTGLPSGVTTRIPTGLPRTGGPGLPALGVALGGLGLVAVGLLKGRRQ
ncbi:MAG: hypothetical protein EPO26_02845 [Chloroflexota bacterium]|nr:MAG: hypothetical protein EPO26_02845 [Chloroflexota bacterium]